MNFYAKINRFLKRYAMYFVLLVLCIFFSITSDVFLTSSNLLNLIRQCSMAGIAAVGVMFVILTAGIDLSIGSAISIQNILIAKLMVDGGAPTWAAILLGILLVTVTCTFNGIIITKLKIPAMIVTLAFLNVYQGLAYLLCKGLPIYGFPEDFRILGQGYIGPIPIPIIIMIIVFIFGAIVLNKTYFGRYIYAVGGNEEAARLSGLKVDTIKIIAYAICGFFVGIAGMVMLSRVNSGQANAGVGFEFDALIGVFLGGVSVNGGSGKLVNVLAGVMVIGILSNGMVLMNVGSYAQTVAKGLVLLFAVGFDCIQHNRKSIADF